MICILIACLFLPLLGYVKDVGDLSLSVIYLDKIVNELKPICINPLFGNVLQMIFMYYFVVINDVMVNNIITSSISLLVSDFKNTSFFNQSIAVFLDVRGSKMRSLEGL